MPKRNYECLHTVQTAVASERTSYRPGAIVEFDERSPDVQRLLKLGAIRVYEPVVVRQVEPDQTPLASNPNATKIELIIAALEELDPANDSLFTSEGKPTTNALEDIVGESVSAVERDAAVEQSGYERPKAD